MTAKLLAFTVAVVVTTLGVAWAWGIAMLIVRLPVVGVVVGVACLLVFTWLLIYLMDPTTAATVTQIGGQ